MSMFLGQKMMTPFFKVHEINLVPKEEFIWGKLKPEFFSKGQTVFQLIWDAEEPQALKGSLAESIIHGQSLRETHISKHIEWIPQCIKLRAREET